MTDTADWLPDFDFARLVGGPSSFHKLDDINDLGGGLAEGKESRAAMDVYKVQVVALRDGGSILWNMCFSKFGI